MIPRFGLKWLLVVVALVGTTMAIATQVGMGTAEFEVWENELVLNERGLVTGQLSCGYVGTESNSPDPWPFDVDIKNVPDRELTKIQPGRKVEVRYRMVALWPLKKQDPFAMYLRRIGVDSKDVVGHVITKTGTKVIIDGSWQ